MSLSSPFLPAPKLAAPDIAASIASLAPLAGAVLDVCGTEAGAWRLDLPLALLCFPIIPQ
eukprot:m.54407 g.54407  ORF g.54407 m.54407 type:complete len:60 (-) comp15510_c0_seq1:208-387(-)